MFAKKTICLGVMCFLAVQCPAHSQEIPEHYSVTEPIVNFGLAHGELFYYAAKGVSQSMSIDTQGDAKTLLDAYNTQVGISKGAVSILDATATLTIATATAAPITISGGTLSVPAILGGLVATAAKNATIDRLSQEVDELNKKWLAEKIFQNKNLRADYENSIKQGSKDGIEDFLTKKVRKNAIIPTDPFVKKLGAVLDNCSGSPGRSRFPESPSVGAYAPAGARAAPGRS